MSGFDWPLVISGCLLAVVQLAIGVAIGLWLRRGGSDSAGDGGSDIRQARLIAGRLQQLTSDVTSIVDEHHMQINRAIRQLVSTPQRDGESLAELVASVVSNVLQANQGLHTRLASAESRLQDQASEIEAHMPRSVTDSLTGLFNRRGFDEQLRARLVARRRHGETFSILLLDVDYFKQLNDKYGHVVGDRMLVAVSQALRSGFREEDVVARYGGEEFAVLMPHTMLAQGITVANKLPAVLAGAVIEEEGSQVSVTLSGGLAMIIPDEAGESLVERADAALYAAKAAGRNCCFMHDGVECRPCPHVQLALSGGALDPFEVVALGAKSGAGNGSSVSGQPRAQVRRNSKAAISAELNQVCVELSQYLSHRGRHDGQLLNTEMPS